MDSVIESAIHPLPPRLFRHHQFCVMRAWVVVTGDAKAVTRVQPPPPPIMYVCPLLLTLLHPLNVRQSSDFAPSMCYLAFPFPR